MILSISILSFSHSPLLLIEDNGDGTIYVEAGFSDGSGAKGLEIRLEDESGNILYKGVLDDFNSIESIPIPEVEKYFVIFDAGPGHIVTKDGIVNSNKSEEVSFEEEKQVETKIEETVQKENNSQNNQNVGQYMPVNSSMIYPQMNYNSSDDGIERTLITTNILLTFIAVCLLIIAFTSILNLTSKNKK